MIGEEVIAQGRSLAEGIMLGVMAGVMYDIFRVLRARVRFLGHFLDFLFWVVCTFGLFIWSQGAWGGRVRIYGIVSIFVGASVYFLVFSWIVLWISYRFADLIRKMFDILTLPIFLLISVQKKIKKNIKNLFLFFQKWYRINGTTHEIKKAQERSMEDEVHKDQSSH